MSTLLLALRCLATLLYGASGVMKLFLFDKASQGVPSFSALPRKAWAGLGALELACVAGLWLPVAFHAPAAVAAVAAAILSAESLIFIWVHVRYRETGAIVMSAVLGLLMAVLAWGEAVLR